MAKKLNRKIKTFNVFILLLYLAYAGMEIVHAETIEESMWSFEFNNISVTDAINKISKVSDIQIIINGDANNIYITKSYKKYSIESILIDIFEGENLAASFKYKDQKLAYVDVWILPKADGKRNMTDNNKFTANKKYNQEITTLPDKGLGNMQTSQPQHGQSTNEGKKVNPFKTFEKGSDFNSEKSKIDPFRAHVKTNSDVTVDETKTNPFLR